MSSVSVSVSREFLGEMTKIVGSFGEVLIFDGTDEAISYLRDSDCLIYKDEEDLQEQVKKTYNVGDIYSQDDITEWVKDNVAIEDVFDDDEITDYAVENNSVSIFSEGEIVEWVQENCEIEDVFDDEEIISAYKKTSHYEEKKKAREMTTSRESIIKARDEALAELEKIKVQHSDLQEFYAQLEEKKELAVLTTRSLQVEALKKENEALKAKVAELERATSDLQLLKNIFGDLIFNHRTAKDGQVWKFNADAGKGEWC